LAAAEAASRDVRGEYAMLDWVKIKGDGMILR
jgi:hypothetical protein